jgi:hypothetical protein
MLPTEHHEYQKQPGASKMKDSAIRRLAKKVDIPMLVALSAADKKGRTGKEEKLTAERWLMKRYRALELDKPETLNQLVLGRHLIKIGIEPGIRMGKILKELYEAQLDGKFDTVADGIKYAQENNLLIEPINKGLFIKEGIAMKKLMELKKAKKTYGKLIPIKDGNSIKWYKSFGDLGLWRKTNGKPCIGDMILLKGILAKVTAVGKDGITARDSNSKYNVFNKDVVLMKGLE